MWHGTVRIGTTGCRVWCGSLLCKTHRQNLTSYYCPFLVLQVFFAPTLTRDQIKTRKCSQENNIYIGKLSSLSTRERLLSTVHKRGQVPFITAFLSRSKVFDFDLDNRFSDEITTQIYNLSKWAGQKKLFRWMQLNGRQFVEISLCSLATKGSKCTSRTFHVCAMPFSAINVLSPHSNNSLAKRIKDSMPPTFYASVKCTNISVSHFCAYLL